ncbi:MAG: hypothetical protein QF473_03800 [Planctomycetota bacterium]|nr:hypothetical protein [Planctomycetota bacterium]
MATRSGLSQPGMHIPRHQHLPLGDATVKNGCLWFLPAIHKLHVLPHHTRSITALASSTRKTTAFETRKLV